MSLLTELDTAATRIETSHAHGRTICRLWGDPAAPAIVLSHGSFGAWSHWVRNIGPLSERFHVMALDLPGMGESDQPPEPISAESMGAIMAEAIDQALPPAKRFQLVGFSFGGIVGGQAALILEHRIDRFTIIGSNALGLPLAERGEMARPNRDMTADEIRAVHRQNLGVIMFGDHSRIDDMALDLQQQNTRRARSRSGAIPRGDSLAHALKALTIPVRGIWGAKDATAGRFLPERQALFAALPNCESFTIIPGAGHWAAYEAADEVNKLLLA
ncbi:MAG: alpha/beta fold hydrolase [Alphaproteobacteria bacterium]|jgi:2-hydroxy-6-oxonona-2,4-dienedioate hydrolase|nr:alpha/beta fold hydrolase [Alphaproteobacteria bacterium]